MEVVVIVQGVVVILICIAGIITTSRLEKLAARVHEMEKIVWKAPESVATSSERPPRVAPITTRPVR
jgi:hypothetical protein